MAFISFNYIRREGREGCSCVLLGEIIRHCVRSVQKPAGVFCTDPGNSRPISAVVFCPDLSKNTPVGQVSWPASFCTDPGNSRPISAVVFCPDPSKNTPAGLLHGYGQFTADLSRRVLHRSEQKHAGRACLP